MADLFGSVWEREHGRIGGERFWIWAEKIETLEPKQIRRKFTLLELKFKDDASKGKDVWPPTLIYFLSIDAKPRENEDAYKMYKKKLMPHTVDEYQEMAKTGMEKVRAAMNHKPPTKGENQ